MVPSALGQTPGFNGYGVTLEDKPKPKKSSRIMGALDAAFKFGAPEAYERGRQQKLQGALGDALKSDDMRGASNILFDMGEYGAGMDMRSNMAAQQGAADKEKMRRAYEMTSLMAKEPDVMRRMQMAQEMSAELGLAPPTDPNEFTDVELQKQLDMMRIKGGFEEAGPDYESKVVNGNLVRFDKTSGNAESVFAADPAEKAPAPGMIKGPDGSWIYSPEYLAGQREMRAAGRPTTTVTVGGAEQPNPYANYPDGTLIEGPPNTSPLPDGQYWEVRNGQPSVAVAAGSEAEQDAITADEKAQTRRDYDARSGRTVLRDVNRGISLLDDIYGKSTSGQRESDVDFGLNTVASGAKRVAMAQVPGTPEYVFKRNIRSAKSNIGLDRLQGVRDFSPTGGALGQIPVQQQEKLEETIGALDDLGLPRAYLEENLRSANNDYLDIVYGSPSQRARFVAQGIITPEDNAWIEAQYDSLGYDAYGNYMLGDANYTRPVIGVTLPDGSVFTEDDLITTMEANGMSRLEVEAMVRASLR